MSCILLQCWQVVILIWTFYHQSSPDVGERGVPTLPSKASDIELFLSRMRKKLDKDYNSETSLALEAAWKRFERTKTGNQKNSVLHTIGTGVLNRGAGRGKNRCQPTSIARRGPGKPRGAAPLGKWRRPSNLSTPKSKRPRCLSDNIEANVANGKSHGSGH